MQTMSGWARFWAAATATLAALLAVTLVTGPDSAAPAAAAAAPATVEVTLSEFAIEPAELTAPAGVPLTFQVANDGSIPHDFAVEGEGATEMIDGGATATLQLDALEPGTYTVLCNVPGHGDAGMRSVLSVTEDGEAAGPAAAHDGASHQMSAEEMAAKHDDLSAFPAETAGAGNQPLQPEVADDGTKVFELTADEIEWETAPGETHDAVAYNGQIPGPRLDVDLGDHVRIVLRNELDVPTALHLHGLVLPNEMDGVPGITQSSVMPGESFTYELTVTNAGSHMYHSHFDSANQVPGGLLGAFVVHAPDDVEVDHDVLMILNDGPLGYTLNGKGFPATAPVSVQEGETIRVRYMNEGLQVHPMHLHGMPQQVVARDGYPLAQPVSEDNVLVSPGDRVDVIVEATEAGTWAWHCHILSHAEGPDGMFGMVTALIVE